MLFRGALRVGLFAMASVLGMPAFCAELGEDEAWLRSKGTLIFEDSFDREESGNGAKAIGNGWNSATADRVPHLKQADLEGGVLKIHSATREAGHAAHIHHEIGFQDGGVRVRFKFPGLAAVETMQVGFVDRECQSVHAGHLGYAILNASAKTLTLRDSKTGGMDLRMRKRVETEVREQGKPSAELQAFLKSKERVLPWVPDREWHELVLVTEGDELRASLDGKRMGQFRSEGFAHPVKRWLSFLPVSHLWIEEVQVWKVK